METKINITDIIFDFDGTCTQIAPIEEGFLKAYFDGFSKQMDGMHQPITPEEWKKAIDTVRKNSPIAGWTVATTPSAPAAADPYILAGEAANLILRNRQNTASPDFAIYSNAYSTNSPVWRDEAEGVFKRLQEKGINLHLVSNSSKQIIQDHLKLLKDIKEITVEGNAAKFNIRELNWDPAPGGRSIPETVRERFTNLPVAYSGDAVKGLGRPAYLRRGSYFEAICRTLNNDLDKLATTLFCGDIWELDLAMPYALGANIHLIERASPYTTYLYEHEVVQACGTRARSSNDLTGLLDWF